MVWLVAHAGALRCGRTIKIESAALSTRSQERVWPWIRSSFYWNRNKGHQMPTSPSSLPERSHGRPGISCPRPDGNRATGASGEKRMPEIRRLAMTIIGALMADADPERERERQHLSGLVETYPGQPDVALAQHLLAVRRPLFDDQNGWTAAGPRSPESSANREQDR